MTVFATISLMLVAAFLLVLLEGARVKEMRKIARMNTDSVIESVFAEYQRPLWDMYHILAFDSGQKDNQAPFSKWEWYVKEISEDNVSPKNRQSGNNYLAMGVESVDFENYRLLTDEEGREYIATVSEYMKNNCASEVLRILSDQYDSLNYMNFGEDFDASAIGAAEDAIRAAKEEEARRKAEEEARRKAEEEARRKAEEEARRQAEEEARRKAEEEARKQAEEEAWKKAEEARRKAEAEAKKKAAEKKKKKTVKQTDVKTNVTLVTGTKAAVQNANVQLSENPLDVVKDLWKKGILSLVIENQNSISQAKIALTDIPSQRKLCEGTCTEPIELEAMDHILFSQYTLSYFSSYTSKSTNSPLSYELEYLLCGKAEDIENLKNTVRRLLAIRTAANLLYLEGDLAKQELALQVATALAGASANPLLIYTVKVGIITAWALAESLLDVRTLLSGGKIAVIKNSSQWTTDILHLGSAFSSFGKAINCANGLSYNTYLGFLLFLNEQRTCYRSMDLLEAAVRAKSGYENFQIDHMVTGAQLSVDYKCKTIFLGMENMTSRMKSSFYISTRADYSYRKAGA